MRVSAVACMSQNRVIGRDNKLPWHLPRDLKRFRDLTAGHPVIMGRKTYESIGAPLPKRQNIVVSRQAGYIAAGVEVVKTVEEALKLCEGKTDEAFIVGGAELWRASWPLIDRIYLTIIHRDFEGDAFFPDFDMKAYRETEREEFTDPMPFTFITLERQK